MAENLNRLIRWLTSLHAPLGRWTPMAASALFAAAGLSHSSFLRSLAFFGATILIVLIAADLTCSLIDGHAFPKHAKHGSPQNLLMLGVRLLLSVVLGGIYALLVFIGVGPWTPYIFLPVIFFACCAVAWRNISLWYEQGEEFEEALHDAEHHQHSRLPQGPIQRMH
ncbi:MAG TPA: hypothetical protein VKT33_02915 [Candidatus Angelobacter sp.]|nr:hypothetical protein [Candidatus Angelobacter sp.]